MRWKRLAAVCCALAVLCVGAVAGTEGLYFGSHPEDDVYMTQSIAHTCTLIACTMMLRNYSCQRGSRVRSWRCQNYQP